MRLTRRAAAAFGCLGAILVASHTAVAQSEVEDHLQQGVALRRAGHDEAGAEQFALAYHLGPSPRTAAMLGLARQSLGLWLDAHRLLHEALASPEDPWIVRNRPSLDAALAVVAQHVGAVDVRCDVEGAEVWIEGAQAATLPLRDAIPVHAGVVSMEVRAQGHETVVRRFLVDPGALVRETVSLRPIPGVAAAGSPQRSSPETHLADPPTGAVPQQPGVAAPNPTVPAVRGTPVEDRPVPWSRRSWALATLTGAGVALGVGVLALAVGEDAAVRYNSNCPAPPVPEGSDCAGLANTATVWRTTGWVALPLAGVLTAIGVTLLALPKPRSAAAAWHCAPVAPGWGVGCGTVF